jgi:serine-type D-Ala-D-Ala carboxypeptidase (penicillin-binding protein 5/6)
VSTGLLVGFVIAGLLIDQAYRRPLPALQPILTISSSAPTVGNVVPTLNIIWAPYGEQVLTVTGTSLTADNGGQGVFPTASTAKVMMALLILQKHPLTLGQQGPNIPVTDAIVAQYEQELAANESVVAVQSGEQLTEYQALEAMLVPSATNIADLLASWGFGSIAQYTVAANQMAVSLGMTQTHFDDASGFSPATVSTAGDLVKLGQAALQNPVVAQIVAKPSVALPVVGTVQNFNIELGQSGINGIKTGNTDQAGGVFLFSAPYDNSHTIIGATMNAPDLGTALHDAPEILDSFKSNLQTDTPIKQDQVVAHYKLPWGGSIDAVAQKDLSLIDWTGTQIAVHTSLQPIKVGQSQKTPVGTASFTFNGTTQTTPVILSASIPQPSLWWRALHSK